VVLQVITVTSLVALIRLFPSFQFQEALLILVVLVVALTWGVGPGLLATLAGATLLTLLFLPPVFSLMIARIADGLLVYLAVGLAVSLLASQVQQARRATEHLGLAVHTFRELGARLDLERAEQFLEEFEGCDAAAQAEPPAPAQLLTLRLAEAVASRELLLRELAAVIHQETRAALAETIGRLTSTGYGVLFVTHDVEEAIYLSDEVHVMGTRPGRIIANIPVPLARPRTRGSVLSGEFLHGEAFAGAAGQRGEGLREGLGFVGERHPDAALAPVHAEQPPAGHPCCMVAKNSLLFFVRFMRSSRNSMPSTGGMSARKLRRR